MRKVVTGAFVSLDGVMQAPGGPTEDPSGGFEFGGWLVPLMDEVFAQAMGRFFEQPFDLLLGRKTYDIFAAHWPNADDSLARQFNACTKYVATRSAVDLKWRRSVAIRDVATEVGRLRQEDGPTLITQGSSELVHALLANGLVDEIFTLTAPIVLGNGKRFFAADANPVAFRLLRSEVSTTGLVISRYARAGSVETGNVPL